MEEFLSIKGELFFFYEILRHKGEIKLEGPIPGMFFLKDNQKYAYVQVIDGSPKGAFTADEMLVTSREL